MKKKKQKQTKKEMKNLILYIAGGILVVGICVALLVVGLNRSGKGDSSKKPTEGGLEIGNPGDEGFVEDPSGDEGGTTPSNPDTPSNPETPSDPDTPNDPDTPETPSDPDTPNTPGKPSGGSMGGIF